MTHELEPTLPDGERPVDDSDMLKQEWIIEALVIAKGEKGTRYVVTEIISGEETVNDHFYPRLLTSQANYILSPEQLMDYSYRGVYGDGDYGEVDENGGGLDTLKDKNADVTVGDRIRIVRWSQQIPHHRDGPDGKPAPPNSWTVKEIESVTVLETGIDIRTEEAAVLERKQFIRENLAAILRRLEQLQLNQQNRLQTDVDSPIEWNHGGSRGISFATFVYGEDVVEDHFVRVKAAPYKSHDEVPLGGDTRFTTSGRAFLARDITAGEPSKELALVEEPLVELSGQVWTETALNPAVDSMRVDFIIDGVRYTGVKDIEMSSHYFEKPGHELQFNSFSVVGEAFDGIEITPEEMDALHDYRSVIHSLTMRAINAGLEAKIVRKELGEAASTGILPAQSRIRELELIGEKAFQGLQPIVEQIKTRPSDIKLGIGGRLLVPKSKLEDVRVVIGRK